MNSVAKIHYVSIYIERYQHLCILLKFLHKYRLFVCLLLFVVCLFVICCLGNVHTLAHPLIIEDSLTARTDNDHANIRVNHFAHQQQVPDATVLLEDVIKEIFVLFSAKAYVDNAAYNFSQTWMLDNHQTLVTAGLCH